MKSSRTGLLALLVLAGTALGTLTNGWLNLGDDIKGDIDTVGQEDVYEFTAIAGTKASFKVRADSKSKKKTLWPRLRVVDLTTNEVLADESDKKTVKISYLELESTGSYELIVSGANDTTGKYRGETDQKLDKSALKMSDTVTLGSGEKLEIEFVANEGWELDAKIKPKNSDSEAFMTNAELKAPSGKLVYLSGLEENGPRVVIKDLPLPELGTYLLTAENTGLSGLVKWAIKLDPDDDDHGDDDDDDDHGDDDDDDHHDDDDD